MALNRIERVLRHDGIVAVLDMTAEQAQSSDPSWVGEEKWKPIVLEAVKLRQIANEPSVRVLVGDHAVLVSGDEKHVVGVVFIKGHPVEELATPEAFARDPQRVHAFYNERRRRLRAEGVTPTAAHRALRWPRQSTANEKGVGNNVPTPFAFSVRLRAL